MKKKVFIVIGVLVVLFVIGRIVGNKNTDLTNVLSNYIDGTIEVTEKGTNTEIKISSKDESIGKVLQILKVLKDDGYKADIIKVQFNEEVFNIAFNKNIDKIVSPSTEEETIKLLSEISE